MKIHIDDLQNEQLGNLSLSIVQKHVDRELHAVLKRARKSGGASC